MTEQEQLFSEGDWVFHLHHGVGQITGIEEKTLGDKTQKYYEVEARKGTFWISINKAESDRIRPVVNQEELEEALRIIKAPPQTMADKHTSRKSRISQVTNEGELSDFCALLRDLQARRVADKLNTTEQRAHRRLKKRIASEWSASSGKSLSEINKELNKIILSITSPEKSIQVLDEEQGD
ncbi:MAG: hypothetical protein MAG431_01836 [Chloroflexi bacterium]|nr:hypothetical protein [Chloroflexota bacterium]